MRLPFVSWTVLAVTGSLITACGHQPERLSPSTQSSSPSASAAVGVDSPSTSESANPSETPAPEPPTEQRFGLTVDSVDELPALVEAVQSLETRPTLRIVFDAEAAPEAYASAIHALSPHADLMGQIVDSTQMSELTAEQITARTQAFVNAFKDQVAIWEVGNEVNGEWVGPSPEAIWAKVAAANAVVKAADEPSAVTFNYWSGPDCYAQPWEVGATFAAATPAELRGQVDYALLSVYETACDPPQHPTADQLAAELAMLGEQFPQAKLGIGEIGAQGIEDDLPADPSFAEKERIARTYLPMNAHLSGVLGDRFIGGWFWWYFVDDAVPANKPESLWPLLNELSSLVH